MSEWPTAALTYPDDAETFEVVHPGLRLGNTAGDHDFLVLLAGLSIGANRKENASSNLHHIRLKSDGGALQHYVIMVMITAMKLKNSDVNILIIGLIETVKYTLLSAFREKVRSYSWIILHVWLKIFFVQTCLVETSISEYVSINYVSENHNQRSLISRRWLTLYFPP